MADVGPVEAEYTGKGRMGSGCSDLNVPPPIILCWKLNLRHRDAWRWHLLGGVTVLRALPSLVD